MSAEFAESTSLFSLEKYMMNPPKPALKFVIHSKIQSEPTDLAETSTGTDKKHNEHKNTTSQSPTSAPAEESASPPTTKSDRSEKDSAKSAEKSLLLTSTSNPVADRKRKRPDKETVPLASKKIHDQLKMWNKKKKELKASDDANDNYFDLEILACLLCQRKFKSSDELKRHGELSTMHNNNLEDPACVEKAQSRMRHVKNPEVQSSVSTEEPSKHRNRPGKRREKFNPADKSVHPASGSQLSRPSNKVAKMSASPQSSPAASVSKPLTNDNVGARMLQQMGWRHGEGLGKDNSGIVDPVLAERYAQGVGLGSIDAKSSISAANGTETYKELVMNRARRRLREAQSFSPFQ